MKIVILPGDGIGLEIMPPTVAALAQVNARFELGFEFDERAIGLTALERDGTTLPDPVMTAVRDADAVVLGPIDSYKYPPRAEGGINISAELRTKLQLYANIRPARTRPGVSGADGMDLVMVRENTEGFYADRSMFDGNGEFMPTPDLALSVRKITRSGSSRVARQAFELARRRRGRVAAVHKANVLKLTDGLFLESVRDIAKSYADVELDEVIVDAMAAHLIRDPAAFDIVLATNMFGDILSDEAAQLAGGLGLAPSVNVGDGNGIAQAVHGAAPDNAGRGIANPTALMLSAAMLLEWLSVRESRDDLRYAGKVLEGAIEAALSDRANHTPDLGGSASTAQFGEAVLAALKSAGGGS